MNQPIFVFGSNLSGIHGKGAALYAFKNHNAIWGQREGLQGNSYAIPTKDQNLNSLSLEEIKYYIERFLKFAEQNDDFLFLLTPVGCGLAGYSRKEISKILYYSEVPKNVVLTREWLRDYEDILNVVKT